MLRCLLPDVRGVIRQDDFRIAEQDNTLGTVGVAKEPAASLDKKFDIQGFGKALKALRSDCSRTMHLLDKDRRSSSDRQLYGVGDDALRARLQREAQHVQHVPAIIVEGHSLYKTKAICKLIDVRIYLIDEAGMPSAPITGTLRVDGDVRRERRKRGGGDRFEVVVWGFNWWYDIIEGIEGQPAESIVDKIGIWMLRLVADAARARGEGEGREANDGGYQICDCGDGMIGRVRRWVSDRL